MKISVPSTVRYRGAKYRRVDANVPDIKTLLGEFRAVAKLAGSHSFALSEALIALNESLQKNKIPSDIMDALTDKAKDDFLPRLSFDLTKLMASLGDKASALKSALVQRKQSEQ